MLIRKVLFVTLVLFASSLANAQSVKLTSVQISEILNGNTASGIWGGEVYHQYFGVDGITTTLKQVI